MKKFLLSGIGLFFASLLCVSAQELKVSGKVVSAKDGTDLPGVNIQIRGTTRGTITNGVGEYELIVRSAKDSLLFSFIGHETAVEIVGQRNRIDVRLQPEATELQEVVITGFQDVDKKIVHRVVRQFKNGRFENRWYDRCQPDARGAGCRGNSG